MTPELSVFPAANHRRSHQSHIVHRSAPACASAGALLLALLMCMAVVLLTACSGPTGQSAPSGHPASSGAAAADGSDGLVARAQLRERALHVLSSAAGGADPELRANAIEGLQAAPARLSPVAMRTARDENPAVRAVTAMAVARAGACGVSDSIAPLADDDSPMVRAAALLALRRCGVATDITPLAGMLNDSRPEVRMQAAWVLGELGEASAIPLLREAARSSAPRSTPAQQRLLDLQIAEARVKLGDDDALADIRTALYPARPEDLEATALAVKIAGDVGDRASMDQLVYLTALKDGRQNTLPVEVRLAAAGSMAKLGNRQGKFIADQYRAAPLPIHRAQAAFVYGEIGRPESLPNLEQLLKDPSEQVRVSAAYSILRIVGQPPASAAAAMPASVDNHRPGSLAEANP